MFTNNSTLADEITTATGRLRRERDLEANELERVRRFDAGKCRDCNRKRRPTGKLCGHCRNRIEKNTPRDLGKQARRGRLSIQEADGQDLKLAVQAICQGASGLGEVSGRSELTKFERRRFESEPLSQLLLGVKSAFEIAKRRGQVDEWLEAIKASLSRE